VQVFAKKIAAVSNFYIVYCTFMGMGRHGWDRGRWVCQGDMGRWLGQREVGVSGEVTEKKGSRVC